MLVFYALVFALSWGPILILAGPGAFLGTTDYMGNDAELTSAADLDPVMYATMLAGAPSIALAGILVIGLAFGRAGLLDLGSRLIRWRVGARWYAIALLTAPLLWIAILFAFLLTSEAFLPDIITAEDKASLLVTGLVAGLVASVFEELGWTGLATNELSKRYGLLATGLLVGLPWCALHLPLFAGTSAGSVPPALHVAVSLFSWLLPYRVLMVWVYGHTQSVLLAILMHLPITFSAFLLGSPAMLGVPNLIFNLVFGATLWALAALVAGADRREKALATRVVLRNGRL